MPIRKAQQFEAWSYSRLSDWEECPRKAALKHIGKLKEPANAAMDRGKLIHGEAARYATRRLPEAPLPPALERFPDEFAALRARPDVECELQLAVNRDWQPCEWFGPDAWLRVVIDCTHAGVAPEEAGRTIIDFKTGKVRAENADQLDLYGLVALARWPGIKRADAALWYLDQGEIVDRAITLAEAKRLRQAWMDRAAPMLTDTTFDPKPGDACRWCWYGQDARAKGGPGRCEH